MQPWWVSWVTAVMIVVSCPPPWVATEAAVEQASGGSRGGNARHAVVLGKHYCQWQLV